MSVSSPPRLGACVQRRTRLDLPSPAHARDHIAVTIEVLGRRVHDHARAEREPCRLQTWRRRRAGRRRLDTAAQARSCAPPASADWRSTRTIALAIVEQRGHIVLAQIDASGERFGAGSVERDGAAALDRRSDRPPSLRSRRVALVLLVLLVRWPKIMRPKVRPKVDEQCRQRASDDVVLDDPRL